MRRILQAAATAIVMLLGMLPPAAAQVAEEPVYPELAGVTTITAEGNAGVTLRVPSSAALPSQGIVGRVEFTVEGTDHAYIAMGAPECDFIPGVPRLFCTNFDFWAFPGVDETNFIFSAWEREGEIEPGLLNVYVLSDGMVTFTARFDGLDGTTTVPATGDIDGIAQKLPVRCPDLLPDCSNIGYGGATHEFHSTGMLSVLSYSEIPDQLMGQQGNTSCFYPSNADPDVSPEVEDHPYGCDLTPTEGGSNNWLNTTSQYMVNRVGNEWTAFIQGQAYEQGRVYAGFNGDQISAVPGGHFGAIGVWLHKGISCPSNDFSGCKTMILYSDTNQSGVSESVAEHDITATCTQVPDALQADGVQSVDSTTIGKDVLFSETEQDCQNGTGETVLQGNTENFIATRFWFKDVTA